VIRVVAHDIEQGLAHIESGTVEDEGIGAQVPNQIVDGIGEALSEDLMAAVTQRKGQKLGDLRRVVDEQDAAQA